jgi:hypothetical protein
LRQNFLSIETPTLRQPGAKRVFTPRCAGLNNSPSVGHHELKNRYTLHLQSFSAKNPTRADSPPAKLVSVMATFAQKTANQQNSQHSTGPVTDAGKAAVSQNNFRHGFTGAFRLLPGEDPNAFETLQADLRAQHQPGAGFETTLVEKMAQHFWLAKRALAFQDSCFNTETPSCDKERLDEPATLSEAKTQKMLALYLRYQTTHDRAFYKCADELRKLRAEKRKVEIGFESQQHKRNEEKRRQADADRKQHLHIWRVLQLQAEVDHQTMLNEKIAPEGWDLNKPIRRIEAAEKAG